MMKPQVSLVKCSSYDEEEVYESVERAVSLLGGMKEFVKPNERVLIKPNLLRASEPEKAIVTHPAVVRAVILLVQDALGKAVVCDSPGGPANKMLLKRAYEKAGLIKLAGETGAQLVYDTSASLVPYPNGKLVKAVDVLTAVARADAVITLPKLKTHSLTYLTGAAKILYGVVPGLSKAAYHAKFADVDKFSLMLLDILSLIQPRLSIMDAVVAMDGNGPSAGTLKNVGAILAGADHLAVDVVASVLVGFKPMDVSTIRVAVKHGLSSGRLEDIEVLGDGLEELKVSGFTPPVKASRPWFMPYFAEKVMRGQLTVYPASNDKCVGCGVCKTNCPINAITIKNGKARMNLSKCIRCYCCHETCPHNAIDLKKPLLSKIFK